MMNCPTREHLAELAMAVANKEVLSPEIESASAHTNSCPECRTLLRSYLETIGAVRKAIEADADAEAPALGECPDFNSLAAYVDDALSPEERDELERHAAHCPRCLQELADLTELKVNLPAATPVFSYLVDITKAGLAILRHPANGF